MQEIKKVAQNTGIIIVGNTVDTLCNFLISISLARYFGNSGFGKLSFLAVFFFFFGVVDNQLIRPILVREISRNQERSAQIIGNGLIMKGLLSALAILLFWLTIYLLKPPIEIAKLAFFTSIGLFITSMVSSYEITFQIKLKMIYSVIFNSLSKVLTLILIYIIVLYKGGLFHFYVLSLIPGMILLLQIKLYSEKIIKPRFEIDFELWRKVFKESWPLGLTAIFIFLYHRIDQIILFHLKGPGEVGLYSAAARIAESFNVLPVALMVLVLPFMSRYYELSRNDFESIYRLSFKYLLIFIIPVATCISFFSDTIATFFYGGGFSPSSQALYILIWAEVFVFLGIVNNSVLIASGRQRIDPVLTGVSAFINIVLNLILIPKYGIIGAAVVSLVSYAAGPILGYFIPATREFSRCMFYYSIRPILASSLMACFIYFTGNNLLLSLFLSPVIYLVALYFIKGITQEDIRIAKSVIMA